MASTDLFIRVLLFIGRVFDSNLRVWPGLNLYQKKSPDTVAKLVCDVTLPRFTCLHIQRLKKTLLYAF